MSNDSRELPKFRFHLDPVRTGAFVSDSIKSCCCGQLSGLKYDGPVFGKSHPSPLCPWCIADGSAANKFGVEFTDPGASERGPTEVFMEELATRTPGYESWQGPYWTVHCGDFCQLIDRVGGEELRAMGRSVLNMIWRDLESTGGFKNLEDALVALERDGNVTGYLFRCLKCGTYRLHWDSD